MIKSILVAALMLSSVMSAPCGDGMMRRAESDELEGWPKLDISLCRAYDDDSVCSKQGKAVATKCIKETENGCAWNDFKDYDGNRGLVSNGVFKYPQDLAESKGGWQLNVTNASDQQFRLNPSGIATQWKTWTKTCLSEKKYNHVSCRIPVNAKDGTTSTQYVYVDINLAKD